jgi:DNA-directed RNA polymerase specialized sigma24 family protein
VKCPEGLTEAEVVEAIGQAVDSIAHSFVFGYFDIGDIRQQGAVYALEALPRYDPRPGPDGRPTRPLANFLYRHVRNRLLNLRRDKYRRTDPPCALCHQGRQAEHPGGEVCAAYRKWKKRNNTKANLARPGGFEGVKDEKESSMRVPDRTAQTAEVNEALARIDESLPPALRADYLRMRAKEPVPKNRREKVVAAVRDILCPSPE